MASRGVVLFWFGLVASGCGPAPPPEDDSGDAGTDSESSTSAADTTATEAATDTDTDGPTSPGTGEPGACPPDFVAPQSSLELPAGMYSIVACNFIEIAGGFHSIPKPPPNIDNCEIFPKDNPGNSYGQVGNYCMNLSGQSADVFVGHTCEIPTDDAGTNLICGTMGVPNQAGFWGQCVFWDGLTVPPCLGLHTATSASQTPGYTDLLLSEHGCSICLAENEVEVGTLDDHCMSIEQYLALVCHHPDKPAPSPEVMAFIDENF